TTAVQQFTQEVRFTSPAGQRLTYVVGAFYSDLSLDRDFRRRRAYCAPGTAAQLGTPCTPTSWQSNAVTAHQDAQHIALFGQGEFELVDKLNLIGGLRIQREEFTVSGQTLGPIVPGDVAFGPGRDAARGSTSASDDAVTGKAGLQYRFSSRAQSYATFTRGYKGLGFETEFGAPFGDARVLRPEGVDAYEIGYKGQLFDGRLSLNAAIFLARYTDLQVQATRIDPVTGISTAEQLNAGSSETKGFELEAIWRPTEALTLNTSITYSDASVDVDGLGCPLQFQGAAPIVAPGAVTPINSCYRPQTRNAAGAVVTGTPIQDVREGLLPSSPKWRVALTPRYAFALNDDWDGAVQANVAYQSEQLMSLDQDPLLKQGAYTTVDASLTLTRADDRYSVSLFVRNLFDQNYYTQFGHASTLASAASPNDLFAYSPKEARRYFGVTLGTRF
ncbi:MAG: TonB-dependent receptor, partial [Phenylobacterium sp.]